MENTPLQTLFMSDIGLLSLFTIVFVVAMAGYIGWFVHKNVANATPPEDAPAITEQQPSPGWRSP